MAKKSSIEKNNHRRELVKQYAAKRARLKGIADDSNLPMEERFEARLKLSELPPQLGCGADPQSLRSQWAGPFRLSQDEDVA